MALTDKFFALFPPKWRVAGGVGFGLALSITIFTSLPKKNTLSMSPEWKEKEAAYRKYTQQNPIRNDYH